MLTLDIVVIQMNKAYSELHSWRKVGDKYGLNPATTRMIANGYEPGTKIGKKLGMPPTSEVVVITGDNLPIGS